MSLASRPDGEPRTGAASQPARELGAGHHVQFFDDQFYPCAVIAAYLAEGMRDGAGGIAIATSGHLDAIRAALLDLGVDVAAEVEAGKLVLLAAGDTLAAFCREDEPSEMRFDEVVGQRVRALAARFGRVRAFGEMVDILCRRGRGGSALALEGLWHRLAQAAPLDLLCGYALASFDNAAAEVTFTRVCDQHAHVLVGGANDAPRLDGARLLAHLEQRRRAMCAEAERREQLEAERVQRTVMDGHLAQLTRLLSTSLEYDETVQRVAELAVPTFADWCAVDLLTEDGQSYDRVSIGRDRAADAGRSPASMCRYPLRADASHGVARVIVDARPELRRDVGDDDLRAAACEGEHLALLRAIGVRSWVMVPLRARGRTIGALSLAACDRNFGDRDVWIAEQLAASAAAAIENARLHRATQAALARAEEERRRAEEASRLKDEFLATVSHELRTPLNAVLGWAAMLSQKAHDAAAVAKGVAVIRRNAEAQTKIVEDILDVSRIVTGKLRIDPRPVDMVAIVSAAVDVVQPAADAKQVTVTFEGPSDAACLLIGDGQRLQQAVWNLLSNAIKFTDAGGAVRVRVEQDGPRVGVVVTDTGCGIEAEFLRHVFDPFRQADSSTTRKHGGLGLGLALVRHIVELHGGRVSAESDGPGRGSRFHLVVPVRAAVLPAPTERPRPSRDRAIPDGLEKNELAGARLLVVDDEPDARELIETILSDAGAVVATASCAADALERLDAFRPDVIVSDIGMPGADGHTFIREVRAREASVGASTPAIALTAYARSQDRIRALASGYTAHVPKPVDPAELVAVVSSLRRLARA